MPTSLISGYRVDMPNGHNVQHDQGKLRRPMDYPSPFFDLANFWMPKSIKELFKWCRYYYKNEGLITSTIYKLSEYPVTDLIYDIPEQIEDTGTKKLKSTLQDHFRIKDFLIKIGIDYFVYGNALVSIYFPFKRYLTCPECGTHNQEEDFQKFGRKGDLDFKQYKFKGTCPSCNEIVTFSINDQPVKQIKKINLIRYNPEHFDVKYNEITGQSTYLYNIPNTIRKKVMTKDKETLFTLPKEYFKAIKEKKSVKLKNSNIYHFKRADVSDNDMGWGMPLILPVMKNMFHLQVLRKAQQAIAMEHLVPLRVLFPADNQSDAAPHMRTGLGKWKGRVEVEIKKWKRDPNYIPVMPVPLGSTTVSGDGKMLLLTNEMKMMAEEIINGMGVPQEFVFGGLSWSGSSISLRMLENHFLVYRNHLIDFLNKFLVKKVSTFLGVKPINIKMQEFKMADDIQRKQLLMQLNEANKVSDSTFLKEVAGLDNANEVKQMVKDKKKRKELYELLGLEQGIIQGKVQEMVAEAQAKAQMKAAEAQQKGENVSKPGNLQGYWEQIVAMLEQEEAMEQAQEVEQMEQSMMAQPDMEEVASNYAQEILQMAPDQQRQVLTDMKQEMPELFQVVVEKLRMAQEAGQEGQAQAEQGMEGGQPQQEEAADMRPMPEQRPPRRADSSV